MNTRYFIVKLTPAHQFEDAVTRTFYFSRYNNLYLMHVFICVYPALSLTTVFPYYVCKDCKVLFHIIIRTYIIMHMNTHVVMISNYTCSQFVYICRYGINLDMAGLLYMHNIMYLIIIIIYNAVYYTYNKS